MIGPVIIILTWASLCDWDSLGRADSERRAENNFSSIIIRQRGILRDRRRTEKRETILYSRVGRDWWYFYDISIPWIKNKQGFRIFGRFRFFSANCLTFFLTRLCSTTTSWTPRASWPYHVPMILLSISQKVLPPSWRTANTDLSIKKERWWFL